MIYKSYGKRVLDLTVVIPMFLCAFPVMVVVAILVRYKLGSPIFFMEERSSSKGSTFWIYKFRSMLDLADKDGKPLADELRITKFGKFLRSSSLDELPSLWNILKGDMNLVGPRPLRAIYLERFNKEQARRQEVKPGLTGWAQINGRNQVDWESKFEMDTWYVDHMSLWLDLKIILKTPWKVFAAEGVSAEDHATMPEFMGSQETDADSSNDAEQEAAKKQYSIEPPHESPSAPANQQANPDHIKTS